MEDNFDPDKYLAETAEPESFDPDAYLAETSEPVAETPIEEMPIEARAKLAGAAAYGAVETGKKAATGATGALLEKVGTLTPEQRQTITLDTEAYRKARPMEELQEQFRQLGEQTRERGFAARATGVESLDDLTPFKASELIPSLGKLEKTPKLTLSEEEIPKAKVDTSKVSRLENLLAQKKELEASLSAMNESGIESIGLDQEKSNIQKRLNKVNSDLSKSIPDVVSESVSPSIKPTLKDFTRATNLPPELLQARPELASTKIPSEYGKLLQKEIDFLKTGEMTPKAMASYIKKLQEQASYTPFPTETDKFKQEIARVMSEELKGREGAETYAKGQEISKKSIEIEKGLKEFGLSFDQEGNAVLKNPKKVENLYKKGSPVDKIRFEKLISDAQELGINLENSMGIPVEGIDRFQTELPLSAIRQQVETAKELPWVSGMKRFVGTTIGGSVGGMPGAITGYAGATALPTGTKLQELAALAEGSKAFKGAAKAAKFLGPAAGLATAGLTYAQGMEEGLSTPESAAIAGAEVLNPIPLTDTLEAYKAAKAEFQKPGIVEPTLKAAKAGAQAFFKPMTQAQADIEKKAGMTGQELYRAERGAVTSKSLSESKFEDTDGPEMTNFANFLEQSPDQASQEYARVLKQVISSPDREKAATLYSLNQNPAFRQLAKKYKGTK